MAHVEIYPPGIFEKSSVARRFIMSAVVKVKHAEALDPKNMVSNLMGKSGRRMIRAILID